MNVKLCGCMRTVPITITGKDLGEVVGALNSAIKRSQVVPFHKVDHTDPRVTGAYMMSLTTGGSRLGGTQAETVQEAYDNVRSRYGIDDTDGFGMVLYAELLTSTELLLPDKLYPKKESPQ